MWLNSWFFYFSIQFNPAIVKRQNFRHSEKPVTPRPNLSSITKKNIMTICDIFSNFISIIHKYVERIYLCLIFLGTSHARSRFLISNFRRVVKVVSFLLHDSSASEFYMPTFRNTLFHLHRSCEQEVPVILLVYTTYEDGTDRVFRNFGT
jgi:hypothetical protein